MGHQAIGMNCDIFFGCALGQLGVKQGKSFTGFEYFLPSNALQFEHHWAFRYEQAGLASHGALVLLNAGHSQALMLFHGIAVGHAGNVVRDCTRYISFGTLKKLGWQQAWIIHENMEQLLNHATSL